MALRLTEGFVALALTAAIAATAAAGTPQAAPGGQSGQPGQTAQEPQAAPEVPRPYRGLFGAGRPAEPGSHALDLNLSVYSEYGNLPSGDAFVESSVLDPGWFLGARGGFSFEAAGPRTRVGLRGDAALRYYRATGDATSPRFRLDFGVDSTAGERRRTTLQFGATAGYEPYYILSVLGAPAAAVTGGEAIVPSGRDDLLFPQRRYLFGQTFAIEHRFAARTFLSLYEEARYTTSRAGTGSGPARPANDVEHLRIGARLGRRLTRYAALRAGYGYQFGRFGVDRERQLDTHDIELSIDYRRPLPGSRRTTFGFSSGSSLVTVADRRRWEATGVANLRHEFGAGWFLQGDFARNVQLIEGFVDPFFVNTVTGSLGGFAGRRVELLATGSYSRGSVVSTPYHYTAVQGSVRLRIALASFMAVDVEGLENRHAFDEGITLPGSVPLDFERRAVRCNLALWLPLSR